MRDLHHNFKPGDRVLFSMFEDKATILVGTTNEIIWFQFDASPGRRRPKHYSLTPSAFTLLNPFDLEDF